MERSEIREQTPLSGAVRLVKYCMCETDDDAEDLKAAEEFDAAIARDAEAGKLDALAEEALAQYRAGLCREL